MASGTSDPFGVGDVMKTLVVLEERSGAITAGSLGLLGVARRLGDIVAASLCGQAVASADEAMKHGADVVFTCDQEGLSGPIAQPRAAFIASVLEHGAFEVVLLENTALAADIAGELSVRMNAGVNWDLRDIAVEGGQLIGTRLALGDAVCLKVGWVQLPAIAVMRRGISEPSLDQREGSVENIEVDVPQYAASVKIERDPERGPEAESLEGAEIIVAGGRGLDSKDSLHLLEELADELRGVVAVSMPLVDRGWYPYSRQVGQTGKTVRPALYVACGISGATQHRVGMERSGTIVAINSDATAPIFGVCDLGVVGDLHTVVPRLTELVRSYHLSLGESS